MAQFLLRHLGASHFLFYSYYFAHWFDLVYVSLCRRLLILFLSLSSVEQFSLIHLHFFADATFWPWWTLCLEIWILQRRRVWKTPPRWKTCKTKPWQCSVTISSLAPQVTQLVSVVSSCSWQIFVLVTHTESRRRFSRRLSAMLKWKNSSAICFSQCLFSIIFLHSFICFAAAPLIDFFCHRCGYLLTGKQAKIRINIQLHYGLQKNAQIACVRLYVLKHLFLNCINRLEILAI